MEVEVSSDAIDEGVKGEELEKVIIDTDEESISKLESSCLFRRRRNY